MLGMQQLVFGRACELSFSHQVDIASHQGQQPALLLKGALANKLLLAVTMA